MRAKKTNEIIYIVLNALTSREAAIICMRYGLDSRPHEMHEVGMHFNVSRKCIQQIEAKVLRMLRHPGKYNGEGSEKDVKG